MNTLYKLQLALRKLSVRLALGLLLVLLVLFLSLRGSVPQDPSPLLRSQDISQITALAGQRERLDYLLVAAPLSDAPRYIFKFKDAPQLHVVKVPSTSHLSLEREVLLRNAIPYAIARDDFLAAHKAVLQDDEAGLASAAATFLQRHGLDLLLVGLALYVLKAGLPGMGVTVQVLAPDQLHGSMDDLIGMDDIKQEVRHLEDMLQQRALYQQHAIDQPFNVMLTGPAGTGKTKLAGYLAKRLNVPLIQMSASALESGYIGGGSKALRALHRKACALGQCIIFLDEAQGLFMPRGRGDKKWEDDTANTLLGLLDGVRSADGAGVIWIVASNFDDASTAMDPAMLRRFPVKINFRLPNKSERRALLHAFLARKADGCVDWERLDLAQVAEVTANLSPALLLTVVERASMLAIQEHVRIDTALMLRAFERATIGLTDRATSADKERQRERVALHELGHFFMQIDPWLRAGLTLEQVRQRSPLLKISTESVSKLGALGYVLSAADDVALKTLDEMEADVIQLYGGVAAEELFYGARGISVGSQNDIQKATTLLDLMVNQLSMYSRAKLDYRQFGGAQGERQTLAQVEAKAEQLYSHTLQAISPYRPVIAALQQALLEHYVLSKDALFDLLAEHRASLPPAGVMATSR
ncbi:MAG: AAA family ATPase [Sphingomonadaceae bacterium]